jgi:hypothetical protein
MKLCLRQWQRPSGPYVRIEGVGNCDVCVPHEDNKNCRLYYPINITVYEVEEKDYALHTEGS